MIASTVPNISTAVGRGATGPIRLGIMVHNINQSMATASRLGQCLSVDFRSTWRFQSVPRGLHLCQHQS